MRTNVVPMNVNYTYQWRVRTIFTQQICIKQRTDFTERSVALKAKESRIHYPGICKAQDAANSHWNYLPAYWFGEALGINSFFSWWLIHIISSFYDLNMTGHRRNLISFHCHFIAKTCTPSINPSVHLKRWMEGKISS